MLVIRTGKNCIITLCFKAIVHNDCTLFMIIILNFK